MQILLVVTTVLALLATLLAFLALRANRTLRRALMALAEATGQATPEFRRRWLPRFGLKSMLVVATLLAALLGTFGAELMRAKRQHEIIDSLLTSDKYVATVNAHYRLGILGDGKLAGLLCDWVHPDFGCRADRLQVLYDGEEHFRSQQLVTGSRFQWVGVLRDLESLQVKGLSLSDADLRAIVGLPKLRELSLLKCRLPDGAIAEIARMRKLENLELVGCHLADVDLEGIETADGLLRLVLAENALTDGALLPIGCLESLRELNLQSNSIVGTSLEPVANLPRLEVLSLADNYLKKEHLAALAQSKSLRTIHLYRALPEGFSANLTKEDIEALWKERPQTEIDWNVVSSLVEWDVTSNRPYYPQAAISPLYSP